MYLLIMLLREEFVSGMVHHGQKSIAAMRGVPIMYKKEDFVWGMMVKKYRTRSHKDVPIMHKNEEFVRGTVPSREWKGVV